jgi:hypothetical protein
MDIHLTRLPDINNDRQLQATPYWAYGRFALLMDGSFWFGDLYSSHPAVTKTGWYWAVDRQRDLHVSARGAGIDGEMLVRERRDVLAWLVGELVRRGVIRKPTSLTITEQ